MAPHAISPPEREPKSCSIAPHNSISGSLERLTRDELPGDTIALARFLIGSILVRESGDVTDDRVAARIVEVEAYVLEDAGSHAFRGRTSRNAAMYSERGHAYVYFIYGNHFCLNVVSETVGVGAAVLLRAAAPVAGEATMRARSGERVATRDLLRGPGRLARAFGVDRRFDGVDLCAEGALWLARSLDTKPLAIGCGARIGLTRNADAPLRFYERGQSFVSGPKRLVAN